MAVPDFQSLMLPLLKVLSGRAETRISEARELVAQAEGLTQQDQMELLPSGRQTLLGNRINWASKYLLHAGLIDRVGRGVYSLTDEGRSILGNPPTRIDMAFLRRYPAYVLWRSSSDTKPDNGGSDEGDNVDGVVDPIEKLEQAIGDLRADLEAQVLERIRLAHPALLERIAVELLIAMGYGGGDAARAKVTGRSGDGGIDGKIREDAFGFDEVYVQAKRYGKDSTVGEGELRNFTGAIDAAGARKGLFVTTSTFTRSAQKFVTKIQKRIVLVDGSRLAHLMVEYGVGVRDERPPISVKRIDEDFFGEH